MVPTDLLLNAGAQLKTYKKGTAIFSEGDAARYYFQVESGEIKMNNYNADGKEFIQGIFESGESFGEPPLLLEKTYPANAEALTDVTIYALPVASFFELLKQHPETAIALSTRLANRLYYKSIMASEIASQEPEHRLLKLIDFLKLHVEKCLPNDKYAVKLTRQQLADLTGLRVETVIRAIKALEKKNMLVIENRKIYR